MACEHVGLYKGIQLSTVPRESWVKRQLVVLRAAFGVHIVLEQGRICIEDYSYSSILTETLRYSPSLEYAVVRVRTPSSCCGGAVFQHASSYSSL
jgi:hypothetical protein